MTVKAVYTLGSSLCLNTRSTWGYVGYIGVYGVYRTVGVYIRYMGLHRNTQGYVGVHRGT